MSEITIAFSDPAAVDVAFADGLDVTIGPVAGPTLAIDFSGGGVGDMTRAIYDPTDVASDAFDLANHIGSIVTPEVILDGGLL